MGACLLSALLPLQLASCVREKGTAKERSLQYEVWSAPTLFARRGSPKPGGGETFAKEPISFSFEEDIPLCQNNVDGVPLNIFVMMSSWNNTRLLSEAISSVGRQKLPNFPYRVHVTLVVFEDQGDMLSEEEKVRLKARMDIHFLSAPGSRLGSAGSKWVLLQHLRKIAGPNDYVVMLDGDDVFSDSNVLADLSQKVIPNQPWFAWGSINLPANIPKNYKADCKDVPRDSPDSPDSIALQNYDFRREPFVYCHPRIFSAHLIGVMEESDFQRPDGSFLEKATDRPMIYKMLETAGVDRVHFVDERPPMYNYSYTEMNGLKAFGKNVVGGDKQYVINLPSVPKERQVVHIISAIFDRPIENWLKRLVASSSPDGVDFQFHIGVNDIARLEELQILAKNMSRPGRTILLHPIAENYRGFSRFLVAKKLRLEVKIEFVIFLDDDILVQENTLQTVWERREALTYKCLYGKAWNVSGTSEDRAMVDYWLPDFTCFLPTGSRTPCGNAQLNSSVVEWHYGGSGLSIIDASIFDDPIVFKIPREYLHVEDLWLSYLVLLKRWRIPRLFDIKYDMRDELSNTGQHKALTDVKTTMMKQLATCPTSIFWAFDRNLSTAPVKIRQVNDRNRSEDGRPLKIRQVNGRNRSEDGRDGHFFKWAKEAYFPLQLFWYSLCVLAVLANALIICQATRPRRGRLFRRCASPRYRTLKQQQLRFKLF